MVHRTVEEVKKKWADMLSLIKKKESERRRKMSETGGDPAPESSFKEWEKLVLQALSDVAIEGITCGVDTAVYVKENNLSASSVLLSQSATIPDQPGTSTQVSDSIQERYLALQQEKTAAMETYRKRKLKLFEESVTLQRRSTIAIEHIVKTLEKAPFEKYHINYLSKEIATQKFLVKMIQTP